jgi:hypothetical protein
MHGSNNSFASLLCNLITNGRLLLVLFATFQFTCATTGQSSQFDWKLVEQAIGKPGSIQPEGVYKIGLPRTDLHVKVGDVEVKPTLGTRFVGRISKEGSRDNRDGRSGVDRGRSSA